MDRPASRPCLLYSRVGSRVALPATERRPLSAYENSHTHNVWAAAAVLTLVGGCLSSQPASGPSAVQVSVDKDGHLATSNSIPIADGELTAFAGEVGNQPVRLVPLSAGNGGPTFGTLVAAKQKLKAAGLGRIDIAGTTGG